MPDRTKSFYSSLSNMRARNQELGMPMINSVNDTTDVGDEVSYFANSTGTSNAELNNFVDSAQRSANEQYNAEQQYKETRNGWQRFWDTFQAGADAVAQGVLNFVDGIFDAFVYLGGLFGNDDAKASAQDVMNYDRQQYVLNVGQELNFAGNALTGDIFTTDYWGKWGDTFDFQNNSSRQNINNTRESSFQSELGDFGDVLYSVEEGVGYVLPSIVVGILTGGASAGVQAAASGAMLAATGVSAFGSGSNEALNDGANYYQAGASGLTSAAIEVGTEFASKGIGTIAGKIMGKATTYGTRIGAASFGQELGKLTFKEIGKAALEEGSEEFFGELLSPLSKMWYKGDAYKSWAFGTEENKELFKEAITSGVAGAVGGAFGASVQTGIVQHSLRTEGIDLANTANEMNAIRTELDKEAKKGANANQEKISKLETELGQLTQEWELDMEQFKKEHPKNFENLMNLLQNPKEYIKRLAEENPKLSQTQVEEIYSKSYLDSYHQIAKNLTQDTYERIAELNSTKNAKFKIGQKGDFDKSRFTDEYLKENGVSEDGVVRAYYDSATKTVWINPDYKTEFYEIAAHESISHAILDTNENVRNKIIESIESDSKLSKLFHEKDAELVKLYGKNKATLTSERLARFLENFVKNQKDYNRVLNVPETSNRFLRLLYKIKNALNLSEKERFLKQINEAIERIENSQEEVREYTPKYAFSLELPEIKNEENNVNKNTENDIKSKAKSSKEEGVATGVEVHADIIKDAAQATQDYFINLNTSEQLYDAMVSSLKTSLNLSGIEVKGSKEKNARQTFVDFNTLLNKPEELDVALGKSLDRFMESKISFALPFLEFEGNQDSDVEVEMTLDKYAKLLYSEQEYQELRTNSINLMRESLMAKSQKSKLLKLKEYYRTIIADLKARMVEYRRMSGLTIKGFKEFTKIKDRIQKNKLAVRQVGDSYIPKLEFYNNLTKFQYNYSQSVKNISPKTIQNLIESMRAYTKENITALNGSWTDLNETIRQAVIDLEARLTKNKKGEVVFPNSITLKDIINVNIVLHGINQEMKELISQEGIARQKALYKSDLEVQAIHAAYIDNKVKIGVIQKELNYASSMNSVFANYFGMDSEAHKILYDNVFEAFDNKYIQDSRLKNEFSSAMTSYGLADKNGNPKAVFKEKIKFAGKEITKGHLMDIYAQTLTERGLATLKKGGYSWKLDEKSRTQSLVFDDATLELLEDSLTENEKKFVEDVVANLYNGSWKDYKGESDLKIKGYKELLDNEVYYPTNKADMKAVNTMEMGDFQTLSLGNESFNKRRAKNTEHLTLKGMSFVDRANAYIDGLTRYGELTQTLTLFDSFLNQWVHPNSGKAQSRYSYLKESIPMIQEYIDFIREQITGVNNREKSGKLFGNLVSATLFGNVSVVLKQTASIPTILNEVSAKSFFKAITTGWGTLAEYNKTKAHIEALSGIASQRWQTFDVVASNTLKQEVGKIARIFGIPMEKVDEGVIVLFGWKAAQYEAEAQGYGAIGTPENDKVAIKILNRIIANTQSNSIPVNMSMNRAGASGKLRKVLSYFSSDLQNKVSKLNNIIYEKRYAKQRLETYESSLNNAESDVIQKQEALTKFDREHENVELQENDIAKRESLENDVNIAKDKVAFIEEKIAQEKVIVAGDRRAKEAIKYLVATLLSALMVASADQLVQRLYGRKGWQEDTKQEFLMDLLLEGTVNNLPYMSNFVNAIQYDQDIGAYDFTIVNSVLDIFKDIKGMVEKGKFEPSALFDIVATAGQLTGLPLKNLYNVIMGAWKNIDGSGYSAEAIIKGYSQTYLTNEYKAAIQGNNMQKADGYLSVLMTSYKVGENDEEINEELNSLTRKGYYVLPKSIPDTYNDEEGNAVAFTQAQKDEFKGYYVSANSDVSRLLESKSYSDLNEETKAKLIKKIYDTYYDYAKSRVLNGTASTRLSKLISAAKGKLSIGRFITYNQHISTIVGTKKNTRKELVLKYINSIRGLTRNEKLMLLWLNNYTLTASNKARLGNYLRTFGSTRKEVKELLA